MIMATPMWICMHSLAERDLLVEESEQRRGEEERVSWCVLCDLSAGKSAPSAVPAQLWLSCVLR